MYLYYEKQKFVLPQDDRLVVQITSRGFENMSIKKSELKYIYA